MKDIFISLLMSGFEFYLMYQFYGALWKKRPNDKKRVGIIISTYVILSLLAALPFTNQYALYFGIASCIAVGGLFNLSLLWNLVCTFLFVLILSIGEIVSGALLIKFSDQSTITLNISEMFIISGKIFSKFIGLLLIKVIEVWRKRTKLSDGLYSSPFSLLISAYSCIVAYFMASYVKFEHRPYVLMIVAVIFILIILSNIFLIDLLKKIYQSHINEENLHLAQKAMQHEIKHYQNILEKQKEIYRIIHDVRNKLTGVMGILQVGEVDEAYRMLGEMTKVTPAESNRHSVGNPVIDAIIDANMSKMELEHIEYTQSITMPDICNIKYDDLAVVTGNIFDNAIQACEKVPEGSVRFIDLTIRQMKAYFCISMKNSMQEETALKEETRKDDDIFYHGFGLQNVQMIAEKYQGFVKIVKEEDFFAIFIMLLNDR